MTLRMRCSPLVGVWGSRPPPPPRSGGRESIVAAGPPRPLSYDDPGLGPGPTGVPERRPVPGSPSELTRKVIDSDYAHGVHYVNIGCRGSVGVRPWRELTWE